MFSMSAICVKQATTFILARHFFLKQGYIGGEKKATLYPEFLFKTALFMLIQPLYKPMHVQETKSGKTNCKVPPFFFTRMGADS